MSNALLLQCKRYYVKCHEKLRNIRTNVAQAFRPETSKNVSLFLCFFCKALHFVVYATKCNGALGRLLFCLILLSGLSGKQKTTAFKPWSFNLDQPDGTSFEAKQQGDEWQDKVKKCFAFWEPSM